MEGSPRQLCRISGGTGNSQGSLGVGSPHSLLKQQLSDDIAVPPAEIRVGEEFQACVPRYVGPRARGGNARPAARPDDERLYAPGVEAAAASAAAAAAAAPAAESGPPKCYSFPLPAGALQEVAGQPSERSVRWLGWQMQRLRWETPAAMPHGLRPAARSAEWSGVERRTFEEGLARHGKRFEQILPLLPGRALPELVERYYEVKTHKRMAQIDAEQARLNVRVGPCGTMGCQLHDNHAGPHLFAAPVGPRARKAPRRAEYVVST